MEQNIIHFAFVSKFLKSASMCAVPNTISGDEYQQNAHIESFIYGRLRLYILTIYDLFPRMRLFRNS